jgi:hypothetical protein
MKYEQGRRETGNMGDFPRTPAQKEPPKQRKNN